MRVLLLWFILIASKTRAKKANVYGTDGSNPENEDSIKKGKFALRNETKELQNDTQKVRFHNDYVPSTKTKRSIKSGVSNDTLLTNSFVKACKETPSEVSNGTLQPFVMACKDPLSGDSNVALLTNTSDVACKEPSWYSCLGRCSREWDLGPLVSRMQCFCDSYCETFMDCCADYDKYCSTSNLLTPQDALPNSTRVTPTETMTSVRQSAKFSLTALSSFTTNNTTVQPLTVPFRPFKRFIVSPSPSYEPAATQQTIPATLSSGFLMKQLRDAPDERWKCVKDGHGSKTVGIWMIATCPKQWPADLTRKKCEEPYSLTVDNYNDMLPVSDQQGTNYKNRHCAKCAEANASEISSFELDVTCSVTPPHYFSRSEALKFLFKYCSRIQWKVRDGKHRRYCTLIYSSCQTTSPHSQNCENGSFRIVYDGATLKNYKNIFCATCNKGKASKLLCGPRSRYIDGRSPGHRYNVLLDVLDTTKKRVAVTCPLGKVYDVHLEICRKARMGVPNVANFDKYRVILWLTSTHSIPLRRNDMVTSLAETFNLKASKISSLSFSKVSKIYTAIFDVELERNQTNLKAKAIFEFTKEVTIIIRNVSFTIFKASSRLITCLQVQEFLPSQYAVIIHNNVSMVFLKASKEILRQKDYYAETTESKDGVLIPKGNITVCGKRLVRNCSGSYISLDLREYVILPNGSLFRNVSNKLYQAEDYYVGVNNSVWICTSFVRTYWKEEESNDLRLLAPISIAGLSTSITFLLIVLVTYYIFSELQTIPGIHLVNLSFSLLLSHLLWLLVIVLDTSKASCTVLAVSLHYFFLVSFAWMSIIAYDTWRAFSYKHWHQSRGIWHQMRARVMRHMAVGWLPALIFVVTCTALDQSNVFSIGYGGKTGCWISNRVANLCVFTTPVALSMLFNIVYFLRTIKAIRETNRQNRNLTEQTQKRRDFPIFARIAALMGFSWLFGFLAMLISKYLWYPFTILTTLQGVYIATAFVFAAPRVRKLYSNFFAQKLGRNIVHSAGVGALRPSSNYLLTVSAIGNNSDSEDHRTRTTSETRL